MSSGGHRSPRSDPAHHEPQVRAAGGVVWRHGGRGGDRGDDSDALGPVEVLVVHRPRYDDWTFPKGKLAAGETSEDAARREVEEETGVAAVLGTELPPARYVDHRGRDKVVRYWAMTPVAERPWAPGDEVDDRRWLPLADAAVLLSYPHDRALLAALDRRAPPAARP